MTDRYIEWNGQQYNVDPRDLTMGEYEEIAQRGGPDGFRELLQGLEMMRPSAWRSLFWTQDHRRDPGLAYGDYAGPTARVILDGMAKLSPLDVDGGKGETGDEAPSGDSGSEPSPKPSDTPPANSMP